MAGLRLGARILDGLTLAKVATLAGVVLLAFAGGRGDWAHFASPAARAPDAQPLLAAIPIGLVSVFFSFGGFWEAARIAGEIRDPARTLPRALAFGVVSVTAIYTLTTMAFIYLLPPAVATSSAAVAREAGTALLGARGPAVLATIVLLSVVASAMAMLMMAPRMYEAMSQDGLFPRAVAARHPRTGSLARATALLALLATLYVSIGSFDQIVAFFLPTTLVFVALAAAAARQLSTTLFVPFVAVVVVMVGMNRPWQALAGVALLLPGLVAWRLVGSRGGHRRS